MHRPTTEARPSIYYDYKIRKPWLPSAHPAPSRKKVVIAGSGPAGMAAAQQLARVGHDVTLFEKNDRIGGLLRYGIPDFKMEKTHIDRRVEQMKAEGVTFRTSVMVGAAKDPLGKGSKVTNWAKETVTPEIGRAHV